jgi:hypothetical protein
MGQVENCFQRCNGNLSPYQGISCRLPRHYQTSQPTLTVSLFTEEKLLVLSHSGFYGSGQRNEHIIEIVSLCVKRQP